MERPKGHLIQFMENQGYVYDIVSGRFKSKEDVTLDNQSMPEGFGEVFGGFSNDR